MSEGDSIEEEIQRTYQSYQDDPANPAHSEKIGRLYEQREEYANAIPWLENAFQLGGKVDASAELRIANLHLKALAAEIDLVRQELQTETEPKSKRQLETILDAKLDELNAVLGMKKEIERRNGGIK